MKSRRFFQFSLKSLFVAVTLVALPCGYVAWQREIVEERRVMLVHIKKIGGQWKEPEKEPPNALAYYMASFGYRGGSEEEWYYMDKVADGVKSYHASPLGRFLGEEPIGKISIPEDAPPKFAAQVHNMFPEADIYRATHMNMSPLSVTTD